MRPPSPRRFVARILGALGLVALCAAAAGAQQPVSHETTTVTNLVAVALQATTTNPIGGGPVAQCEISVENGAIRFWVDGTAPTVSTGHLVAAGGAPILLTTITAATGFQAIALNQTATLQTTCARGLSSVPILSFFASPGRLPACNSVQNTNCSPKGY